MTQFNQFLVLYNSKAPNWKKITSAHVTQDRSLGLIIKSVENFIATYNLDPKRLVDSVIDFYNKKQNCHPNILSFKGKLALSIYKNYNLTYKVDLTKTQKILVSVKKSMILLKNLEENGIIYSRGVYILSTTGKADPYFLLAHGVTKGVPKHIVKEWERDDNLKSLVLDKILLDN